MQQYQTSKATVIKAIAIEHKSLPVIQLQIDSNKNILLYLEGQDQSDKLPPIGNLIVITQTDIHYNSTLSDVDLTMDNVLLININDTYIVATNDGAVIRIGTELDFLSVFPKALKVFWGIMITIRLMITDCMTVPYYQMI